MPEAFAPPDDVRLARHATVVLTSDGRSTKFDVWRSVDTGVLREYREGSWKSEVRVDLSRYQALYGEHRSAVVRTGKVRPTIDSVLEPVLGPAYVLRDRPDSFVRSIGLELAIGPVRLTWGAAERYVTSDPSIAVRWIQLDRRGRPVRAMVDEHEVTWTWIGDAPTTAIPGERAIPADFHLEEYEDVLGTEPEVETLRPKSHPLVAHFRYRTSHMAMAYDHLVWEHDGDAVSLVRGSIETDREVSTVTWSDDAHIIGRHFLEANGRFAHLHGSVRDETFRRGVSDFMEAHIQGLSVSEWRSVNATRAADTPSNTSLSTRKTAIGSEVKHDEEPPKTMESSSGS